MKADYKCKQCDIILEQELTQNHYCPKCKNEMKRVWTPTPVHYIGYGWTTKGERK